jgi:hypothetical protein
MVDQNLITIFIALTTLAVLIQTGILVGFFFLSTKLSRQADRAMDGTRNFLGPVQKAAENLQDVTARIAEFGAATRAQMQQLERWWRRSA